MINNNPVRKNSKDNITDSNKLYLKGSSLLQISKELQPYYASLIVGARVNNEVKDLNHHLVEDTEDVELLDLTSEEGLRIYRRSIYFLLSIAIQKLFPNCQVKIEHSVSKGVYGEVHFCNEGQYCKPLTEKDISAIEKEMRELVEQDTPFNRRWMKKAEAIEVLQESGQLDKLPLVYRCYGKKVAVYSCGSEYSVFNGDLVPSTGYLKLFKLKPYLNGFLLTLPERDNPTMLSSPNNQAKMAKAYQQSKEWIRNLDITNLHDLNEQISQGKGEELIMLSEAYHEKEIASVAETIRKKEDTVKAILVAGPSSSGKTTFAQRLAIHLRVNNIKPVALSLDDYFVDRENTPIDEDGKPDFESIEALDLELLNLHLEKLIKGEEVTLPKFNFLTGRRDTSGRTLRLESKEVLIIEGIHGLNERLSNALKPEQKFKIYISALSPINIDHHNQIGTTDIRLIRRIVRDNNFRGHSATATLEMWHRVRRGEEKNIFPFQEEADVMFNSGLVYELNVLKIHVEPLLKAIGPQDHTYSEAQRLLKLLKWVTPLASVDKIPTNSILKEFLGGSCFFH